MNIEIKEKAENYLKLMFGPVASFREGQLEAISSILDRGGKHLVVQKTGWGKSVVYFILTKIMRAAGKGPTLLISPLLALMRNQILNAEKLGLCAETINSSNTDNWDMVTSKITKNQVDLLLVSPERLANAKFLQEVLPKLKNIGLFVVDEVHCISDWGHDFRPDYRRIKNIIQNSFGNVPVLGTTATANDRVVKDVEEQFGSGVITLRGPLARKGLKLQNIVLGSVAERLAWLADVIPGLPGSGIVYCLTRKDVYRVSEWLKKKGIHTHHYWGGNIPDANGADISEQLEMMLLDNKIKVLVSTSALGMGYDKPDIGFVIHYQSTSSAVSYYQQVGRAGRAVKESYGVLLHGREEDQILDYFMKEAFPAVDETLAVLNYLQNESEASLPQMEKEINLKHGRLEKALKHLEIDGHVSKNGSKYSRTVKPWQRDSERIENIKRLRIKERERIKDYVAADDCLMKFITNELDDPDTGECGICANCKSGLLPVTPPKELVFEALEFLSQDYELIDPRKRWPTEVPLSIGRNGKPNTIIPPEALIEQGRALCSLEDAGWGSSVIRHFRDRSRIDEDILDACVFLIRGKWGPNPAPAWITCIPSRERNDLIKDFTQRLANRLGIPFQDVLEIKKKRDRMENFNNSAQKVINSLDTWGIKGNIPLKPLLLVDDFVDSRWTFTITGQLLRKAGVPAVFPFALGIKKEAT